MTAKAPSAQTNGEYIDIVLTGVKLHAAKPRKPALMAQSIERTMHTRKPDKFFGERIRPLDKNGQPQKRIKIANIGPLQELARRTGKQIRIHFPERGIPVYFAKDALEVADNKKTEATEAVRLYFHNLIPQLPVEYHLFR